MYAVLFSTPPGAISLHPGFQEGRHDSRLAGKYEFLGSLLVEGRLLGLDPLPMHFLVVRRHVVKIPLDLGEPQTAFIYVFPLLAFELEQGFLQSAGVDSYATIGLESKALQHILDGKLEAFSGGEQ